MPSIIKKSLYLFLICCVLVTVCYFYVDKPVVFWLAQHNSRRFFWLSFVTHIAEIISMLPFFIYPVLTLLHSLGKTFAGSRKVLAFANCVVIADYYKTAFKTFFGRYTTESWPITSPSLLHGNAYGFKWFNALTMNTASFPSGHATAAWTACIFVSILFPRWKILAWVIASAVVIGSTACYYHFVSDIIAGIFLGYFIATHVIYYMGLTPFKSPAR